MQERGLNRSHLCVGQVFSGCGRALRLHQLHSSRGNYGEKDVFSFCAQGRKEGFWCEFPDLTGCFSDGDTLEELMKNATDAMESWLDAASELGHDIPAPSDVDALKEKADACEEPVMFLVPVTGYIHDLPVRINITSTMAKIAEITAFAKRTHRTRSELMVSATLDCIRANA